MLTFPLSKNLAHSSPQIEITKGRVFSYEEVFGFHHDDVDVCRRSAAFGRGMSATSPPSYICDKALSNNELCDTQLCCTPSELLSPSSQHDQHGHCDRRRCSNGRTDRRSTRRRARHADWSRCRCTLHLQTKPETTTILIDTHLSPEDRGRLWHAVFLFIDAFPKPLVRKRNSVGTGRRI